MRIENRDKLDDKIPLAKLTVSGTINESTNDLDANKVVQRAIIFVIDRSYSMVFYHSIYLYIFYSHLFIHHNINNVNSMERE